MTSAPIANLLAAAPAVCAPAFCAPAFCAPAPAAPDSGHRHYEVYPGSAFKLTQLLDRAAWPYVADHADGFYYHPVGFQGVTEAQRRQIVRNFKSRKTIVEGDMFSGKADGDLTSLRIVTALSLTPTAAIVNRVPPNVAQWQARITANSRHGASTMLMLAPHVVQRTGWADPKLDYARAMIAAPGCTGSGVDAPTKLYQLLGAPYRQAIYDQRDATARQGKTFLYVISPNSSNSLFLAHARALVRDLEDTNHEPDSCAVELYGQRPIEITPESAPGAGVPEAANTITGVAFYLLKHRDGEPGTLTLSINPRAAAQADARAHGSPSQTDTLTLANTSAWLDYAPVVQAAFVGAHQGWKAAFTVGGSDVSPEMLGGGCLFYQGRRLSPGTRQTITVTITRPPAWKGPAPGLSVTASPHTGSAPVSTVTLQEPRP